MKLSDRAGDETIAEALRIAERRLKTLGWRYSDEDVGRVAAKIIASLDAETPRSPLRP
jgi:hypothetical protein